nr:transposase [Rhizobium tibeticum]
MGSEAAFADYVHRLVDVFGHADRAEPLNDYCLGLMLPVDRKSVEPLAAVTRAKFDRHRQAARDRRTQ